MSIVPASRLSRSDLFRLSNNLGRAKRPITRDADASSASLRHSFEVGTHATAQDLSGFQVKLGVVS